MAHEGYVGYKKAPGYDEARGKVKDNASKAVLDEIKRQKDESKAVGQNTSKNMGEFDEAPGGGTPKQEGGGRGSMKKNFVVAESPDDPKAIQAKENGEKVRYMQPRNEDGTFTYNSVNGKGLSTNKSRGTSDIPWLAGIDLTFMVKGAVFKTTDPELKRLMSSITLTEEEMHDAMAIYFSNKGGFAGIVGAVITKKGRESKAEKSGDYGKVSTADTSKMSENTQKSLEESSQKVEKGPFRVGKSTPVAARGAYDPTRTRKGTDRPTASQTREYGNQTDEADIKNFVEQLRSMGFADADEEMVKDLINSGVIKTDTGGRTAGVSASGSSSNDDYEKKLKKSMGLEDDE